MPQQLIDAVVRNDIETVCQLMNAGVDLNEVGIFDKRDIYIINSNNQLVHGTPLAAAIVNKRFDLANILLNGGAKVAVDKENVNGYLYSDAVFLNPFILTKKENIPLYTLKLLLEHCREINPKITWSSVSSYFLIQHLKTSTSFPDLKERVSYFFYEALLRNDCFAMDQCLDKTNYGNKEPEIDENHLADYIADRNIKPSQAQTAYKAIDYLFEKRVIQENLSIAFKKLIDKRIVSKMELESFPSELRTKLLTPIEKPLTELFAELISILYPEKNLPLVPVTEKNAKYFNTNNWNMSLPEIQQWQHPKNIRELLNLVDINAMLARLYNANSDVANNYALHLLAEILFRHHRDIVDNAPLLNETQQKAYLQIITEFCNLSDLEKMLLATNQQQTQAILQLQNQQYDLTKQVTNLNSKIDQLISTMQKKDDVENKLQTKITLFQ